jgi:hypothetical protein
MKKLGNSLAGKKYVGVGNVSTVTLSDQTFAGLLIKVSEYYLALSGEFDICDAHFVSDRYAKRAYYFAVLKEKPRDKIAAGFNE